MTEKEIYDYLIKNGMTSEGACGMMGNMMAESGLRFNNMQDSFEKKLGVTDKQYTDSVDSGFYKLFESDQVGYGLCQWTSSNRKKNLLAFAKKRGVSIANPQMQLDFLVQELQTSYKNVYKVLKTTKSLQTASDTVLLQFERPKDQSNTVKLQRLAYSDSFYKKFSGKTTILQTSAIKKTSVNINKTYPCNKTNYGKSRSISDIKWIVVHYTGNKTDTAIANVKYFQGANRGASAHWFIDSGNVIYESVSPDKVAWSVGKKYGNAKYWKLCKNDNSVSIELCSTNGIITKETLENAIIFIRYLMAEYNVDIDHVIRHKDVCLKNCPGWTLFDDKDWDNFKQKICSKTKSNVFVSYKAKVSVNSTLNIRKGPGTNYASIGTLYNGEIVEIVEEKNGFGRLRGFENSWVCLSYLKKGGELA